MDVIYEQINNHQASFTKGLKKVAAHIGKDPKLFAMHSATDVGKHIGVSETTIIRFCHEIGYEGFSALQEKVRESLFRKNSFSDYLEAKIGNRTQDDSVKNTMRSDIDNIFNLIEYTSDEDLKQIVGNLVAADQILVSGLRSSYSLANWFSFSLNLALGKTHLYEANVDDMQLRLADLTKQSTLVVFSFHRYAEETIKLAKTAKQQGIFIIAFTDSPVSPISKIADISLSIQLQVKSVLDAAPVAFSLMNSIITAISRENKALFKQRAEMFYLTDADQLEK